MDPDKWTFANEWFLRGQIQLLKNIARRKHSVSGNRNSSYKNEDDDEEGMIMEIAALRQEQKELEQIISKMNKRLEATERRPHQMMAFLCKVAEDPQLVPRMMLEKERTKRLNLTSGDKKRRLLITSAAPSLSPSSSSSGMAMTSSSSLKSEEEEDDANFNADNFCQSSPSPDPPSSAWLGGQKQAMGSIHSSVQESTERGNRNNIHSSVAPGSSAGSSGGFAVSQPQPMDSRAVYDNKFYYNGDLSYLDGGGGVVVGEVGSPPPPYPFSLLGGGF